MLRASFSGKCLTLVLLGLTLTLALEARSLMQIDGNEWRSWTASQKIPIVSGFVLGMILASEYLTGVPREAQPLVVGEFLGKDMIVIVAEVDVWYERTGLWNVPLYIAIFARVSYPAEGVKSGESKGDSGTRRVPDTWKGLGGLKV